MTLSLLSTSELRELEKQRHRAYRAALSAEMRLEMNGNQYSTVQGRLQMAAASETRQTAENEWMDARQELYRRDPPSVNRLTQEEME